MQYIQKEVDKQHDLSRTEQTKAFKKTCLDDDQCIKIFEGLLVSDQKYLKNFGKGTTYRFPTSKHFDDSTVNIFLSPWINGEQAQGARKRVGCRFCST